MWAFLLLYFCFSVLSKISFKIVLSVHLPKFCSSLFLKMNPGCTPVSLWSKGRIVWTLNNLSSCKAVQWYKKNKYLTAPVCLAPGCFTGHRIASLLRTWLNCSPRTPRLIWLLVPTAAMRPHPIGDLWGDPSGCPPACIQASAVISRVLG